MYEEYSLLEFIPCQRSILEIFPRETSPKVASVLIKQLSTGNILLENESHLEWTMQAINYAFTLRFDSNEEAETTSHAVKVYLRWASSMKNNVEKNIPEPFLLYKKKYFVKILEALRKLFYPDNNLTDAQKIKLLDNQKEILKSLQDICKDSCDEYKDFVWENVLFFFLNCTNQMCKSPCFEDEYYFKMINNTLEALFDGWLIGASQDYIPSLSYWKTFTELSRQITHHVQLIEIWGNKLLNLTNIIYKTKIVTIKEKQIISPFPSQMDDIQDKNFIQNWFRFLNILAAPSVLHESADYISNKHFYFSNKDVISGYSALLSFANNQQSLSFFITACTLSFLIDIFYGDRLEDTCAVFPAKMEEDELVEMEVNYHSKRVPMKSSISVDGYNDKNYQSDNQNDILNSSNNLLKQKKSTPIILNGKGSQMQNFISSASSKNRHISSVMPSNLSHSRSDPSKYVYNILKVNKMINRRKNSYSDNGGHLTRVNVNMTVKMLDSFMDSLLYFAVTPSDVNTERGNSTENFHIDALFPQQSNIGNQPAITKYDNNFKDTEEKLLNINTIDNNNTSNISSSSITNMSTTTSIHENSNNQAMSQKPYSSTSSTSRSSSTNEILNKNSSIITQMDTSIISRSLSISQHNDNNEISPQYSSEVFVTSICAGKAMALGTLCKIVTSKLSTELIPDHHLAKFYAAIHDALIERDRLVLCTILYNTTNLYNLGLPGVEILLPNYIKAIDIVMTESMKIQLHPSISQIEMRYSCLKALGCLISWPTIFGDQTIIPLGTDPFSGCNLQNNLLNNLSVYDNLKDSILKILIHALRNETDSNNLCYALSLCSIFYEECCAFDLQAQKEKTSSSGSIKSKESINKNNDDIDPDELDEEKMFCQSAVRGIVSAVCDNICKSQWSSDKNISIAAIECINAIPSLHVSIIFDKKDISTASLIVTSLCRFIDNQLMKPPMFHSKDLHSTVVAAYNSLNVWLCAAPALMETEMCLNKVAKTIELGLTGGKNLNIENYNPASQRVRDAADCLLQHVFSSITSSHHDKLVDERRLLLKYGPSFIDTTKFKHFLINHSTLMSIHEAFHLSGFVSIFIVIRTPTKVAHSYYLQLEPKSKNINKNNCNGEKIYCTTSNTSKLSNISQESGDIESRSSSFSNSYHLPLNKLTIDNSGDVFEGIPPPVKRGSIVSEVKQFVFPPDFWQPLCHLDEMNCELTDTILTEKNINDLKQIRECLNKGQSPIGERSLNNKWITEETSKNDNGYDDKVTINSISTFLYEMGLLKEESYNVDFIQLDCGQCDQFYNDLHNMVDKSPVRIPQTVNIYYVKEGQQSINDILNNSLHIPDLDCDFIYMLSDLGDGIQTKSHPFWTGDWNTAYSSDRKPINYGKTSNNYCLDGSEYALYWSDNMMEFAFILPSVKSYNISKNTKNPLLCKNNLNTSSSKKTTYTELKVLIIWLEKLEDIDKLAISELSTEISSNTSNFIAIFLRKIEEDLIEVRIRTSNIKTGKAGPLLDGVSVSKYSLASLLRNTVFNMTRRNIIEFDNYQSLILKRKLAIQDFAKKYSMGITYQEFLNRILTNI
ncbi:Ral GTPase-activating protein subunit beta [Strongyloides ratti]|uniref:Ral GTPase-activating protein subunit beta n=1 Tax=Strongyloides ratti TaxID=34506 RepID=A0A090LM78_STRRB|nr:Ral GTPase-activating protein subunit beta [Strongyloides ratti]CEF70831.1 Ral GTPase-activating protein subunit beta [Strongyloides ratti]